MTCLLWTDIYIYIGIETPTITSLHHWSRVRVYTQTNQGTTNDIHSYHILDFDLGGIMPHPLPFLHFPCAV